MSLGQNAKITYKGIFVIASTIFSTYNCIDTILGYIHQICGILFYVHLPKLIMLEKACPWDKTSLFSFPDVKMHYFTQTNIIFGFDHS